MAKLHEILAVDKDKENQVKKIIGETLNVFGKSKEYLMGFTKTLQMFDEDEQGVADALKEEKPIPTNVPDRINYTVNFLSDLIDVQMQKEATNQKACANIIMENGDIVASNVPATMLLTLERTLLKYRQVFSSMPTLDQAYDWEPDPDKGEHVFKSKQPIKTNRTQKSFDIIELSPATKEHRAQVEKIVVEKPVGTWTTQVWSGMVTPHRKAVVLKRFDELIMAVKKARMRANEQEVVKDKLGAKLFDYILAA